MMVPESKIRMFGAFIWASRHEQRYDVFPAVAFTPDPSLADVAYVTAKDEALVGRDEQHRVMYASGMPTADRRERLRAALDLAKEGR